jgi:23S rRNA (cytidine1920-2'-O)/16S rRNA (cytidine1409-2'-O)-methyltransferase
VRRGLVPSRQQAQALIDAGRVTVGGAPAMKAARVVGPDEALVIQGPPARYVGRGALKLEGALERFAIDVTGLRAYDLGASTGGFTDCLLQRGAASVVALDVGYGQLHERIRSNPKVEVHERTNVRDVRPGDLGPPADLVVADLSFISLRTVLPAVLPLLVEAGQLVLLVKPQFEAGRQEAAQGRGVISDPAIWARVLEEVTSALATAGAAIMGVMASPLTGADGNVEFLVHARAAGVDDPAIRARSIADAVAAGLAAKPGAG